MIQRDRQFSSIRPLLRGSLVLFAVVVGFMGAGKAAQALTVSQVTPCAISATEASICWQTDAESDSVVAFGTSQGALAGSVKNTVQFTTSHKLPMGPLKAGTRYYYQVTSQDKSGAKAASAVLFLDSAKAAAVSKTGKVSALAAASAPAFFDVSIAASSEIGLLYFSVIPEAGAVISVSAAPGSTYTGPPTYSVVINAVDCPVPPGGGCQYTVTITDLAADSTYILSITATASDGSSSTFGPISFGSGSASDDWKISTGGCSDGTAPGACSIGTPGLFCDGSALISYCNKCGYSCPAGTSCRAGGACTSDAIVSDPSLQCNDASCYAADGSFRTPAPIGCNSSWTKCNANVILKVKKDRVCNQWQACESSLEVVSSQSGQKENLCLAVANCAAVDDKGNCSLFLPSGQCSTDPLKFCTEDSDCPAGGTCTTDPDHPSSALPVEYESPAETGKLGTLSGNVVAGLTFDSSKFDVAFVAPTGYFPYSNFQQIGDSFALENGGFEQAKRETAINPDNTTTSTLKYQTAPWEPVGAKGSDGVTSPAINNVLENPQDKSNPNHVLEIRPTDKTSAGTYNTDTAGARAPADGTFIARANSEYIVKLRVKSSPYTSQQPRIAIFLNNSTRDINDLGLRIQARVEDITTEWKNITATFRNFTGPVYLEVVRVDGDVVPFYIDDVSIQPVLKVSNQTLIGRTCRLYPKSDAPACEYADVNGVQYTGWNGYCIQHDPVNPSSCLSWWPVDLIKGDRAFNVFSSERALSYSDRHPLYYCLESKGMHKGQSYTFSNNGNFRALNVECSSDEAHGQLPEPSTTPWSFVVCSKDVNTRWWTVDNTDWKGQEIGLHDYDLASIELLRKNRRSEYVDDVIIPLSKLRVYKGDPYDYEGKNIYRQGDFMLDYDQSSICPTCNVFTFQIVFDQETREIKSYIASTDDIGGDAEPGFFEVIYHQRDICTKLVKVVNDSGEAVPWAARVSRTSNFTVPGLGYTYTGDYAPFGAIVAPDNVPPETWSGMPKTAIGLSYPLYVELADSDNTDFKTPFQARAGRPYACKGECVKQQCLVSSRLGGDCQTDAECRPSDDPTALAVCSGLSQKFCFKADRTTREDPLKQCTKDADCPANVCLSEGASNAGAQFFSPTNVCIKSGVPEIPLKTCSGAGDCPAGDTCGIDYSMSMYGAHHVRQLFTKSFGFWTLNPNTGKYEQTTAVPWSPPVITCGAACTKSDGSLEQPYRSCVSDSDCTAGSTCNPDAGRPPFNNKNDEDYCAIRPDITNAQWDSTNASFDDPGPNTTITLSPDIGGLVKLKFNASLDVEQMPLRQITVNWMSEKTGATQIDSLNLSAAPRSDPSLPYTFFHQYGPEPAGTVHEITISIQDNWGWCNDNPKESSDDSVACPVPPPAMTFALQPLKVKFQTSP